MMHLLLKHHPNTVFYEDPGMEGAAYVAVDREQAVRLAVRRLAGQGRRRIGLAVTPAAPDTVYAIVEAEPDESGFYRSTDRAATWSKQSEYVSGSPQYYQEIVVDPHDADRVYSLDTWMMVTEDGGKTFSRVGNRSRHVDDHALWIDADDTDHLGDGRGRALLRWSDLGRRQPGLHLLGPGRLGSGDNGL